MATLTLSTSEAPRVDVSSDDMLEALAEIALEAQAKAKEAEEEAKAKTDAFKKALEAAGKLDSDTKAVGIVHTTIYPTRRFDETLARSIMTKKLQKDCEKTVLDTAAVKRNVSPADYERMQATTGWTMKLSVAKD